MLAIERPPPLFPGVCLGWSARRWVQVLLSFHVLKEKSQNCVLALYPTEPCRLFRATHLSPLFLEAHRHSNYADCLSCLYRLYRNKFLGQDPQRLRLWNACFTHCLPPFPRRKSQHSWISLCTKLCQLQGEADPGKVKLLFLPVSWCFFSLCLSVILQFLNCSLEFSEDFLFSNIIVHVCLCGGKIFQISYSAILLKSLFNGF